MLKNLNYNPDVLTCLANLSSDEVFTPPQLANNILALLPKEIWSDKNTTFLDPVSKSGVFLREIAKRLITGLEKEIPDKQKRINHIYSKQLFGISITELTALLSRRSLYCSKKANGKYSVCETLDSEQGNIIFNRTNHSWQNSKCSFCGASQGVYDRGEELETHAYQFIHTNNPYEICTFSYITIGALDSKLEALNLKTYLETGFARFLVLQAVSSIHLSKDKFIFLPIQDLRNSWNDEKLYKKYGLSKDEIAFIESMIRPMEVENE